MAPPDSGLRLSPSRSLIEDPAEMERDRPEAEAPERRHQAELKAREYEAEKNRREQEARDAAFRSELPAQFRDL